MGQKMETERAWPRLKDFTGRSEGWLVVLGLTVFEFEFETVFQFISGRLPDREKERRKGRQERKCPNSNPHLLQAQ